MLLKKILILPIFAFAILAFINLVTGDLFSFLVWIFISILSFAIIYPLLANKDDKVVPIMQIFLALFTFSVFASAFAILDFKQTGNYAAPEYFTFGILFGIGVVALIMLLKGK